MDIRTSVTGWSKVELVERAYQLAYRYEQQAAYCPQATLAALQDVFQIKDDNIFKASFGFAGGGGDTGIGFCGALCGGIMAISCFFGRTRAEFNLPLVNTRAVRLVNKLVDLFQEEWGGVRCFDVRKKLFGRELDTRKEEDLKIFHEMHGHQEKCPQATGNAAALAAGIIWDEFQTQEGADQPI